MVGRAMEGLPDGGHLLLAARCVAGLANGAAP